MSVEIKIIESQFDEVKVQPKTEDQLESLLLTDGTLKVLSNYNLPEDFILKHTDIIDKKILLNNQTLSQKFLENALDDQFIIESDLNELNVRTYNNLSKKFIKRYSNHINWSKMLLLLLSSDKIDNMEEYVSIIETNHCWSMVSANQLPKTFIRKYKDKLDWKLLALTNSFTKEEAKEFSDYATIIVREEDKDDNFLSN